ncbi:MAG TPA: sulfite exporter TauE/SafE family protein [Saprospiraceae bacterium]|nr:sulfite exporter TauE/SafE family protein [Saprospiraceae bacterium]
MSTATVILTGLSIGLLGSFHCIGMCGPIALGFTGNPEKPIDRFKSIFLYNFGRAVSYAAMGLLLGLIGNQFALAGYQQILSIVMGVFVILVLLIGHYYKGNNKILARWNFQIKSLLAETLNKPKTPWYALEVGLINAWLPCGLVYLALASAIASGHALSGSLLMFSFGMGTIPLMATLMALGKYITVSWRAKINKLVPVFILAASSLLILRGMNLGIPYISPMVDGKAGVAKCCHRR